MPTLVLGDIHGKLHIMKRIDQWCIRNGITEVTQVGDWGGMWPGDNDDIINYFKEDVPVNWTVCLGNHDNYQVFNALQAEQDAAGAPYEPNSYVRYSHRLIAQRRASYRNGMAFCGGAVSSDANPGFRYNPMMDKMVKYEGRVEGKDWWRDEAPTKDELQAFLDCIETNKPHTIFTHDGPQFAHTARGSEINLKSGLRTDEISRAFETIALHSDHKPARWFFGHHHELTTVTLNGTSYYCCGLHGEGYLVGDTVEEFRI